MVLLKLSLSQWVQITRLPFITASIIPLFIGFALAHYHGFSLSLVPCLSATLSIALLHLGANTINDYFDHLSGADEGNEEFISPFSGGSRSIQNNVVSPEQMRVIAYVLFGSAFIVGLPVVFSVGMPALWLGLAGLLGGYFYTAPPLRLAARKGLGELTIGLLFGPLLVAGGYFVTAGQWASSALFVGLPIGFLVMAIIYINEFPDCAADRAVGKDTLIVVLGRERARAGYPLLLAMSYIALVVLIAVGVLPWYSALCLLTVPIAKYASKVLYRHFASAQLAAANAATIKLHSLFGVGLVVSLVIPRIA